MLTGKTESGYEYEIDEAVLDDYYFIKAIGESEEHPERVCKVIEILFGDKVDKALEFVKEKTGRTSMTEVTKLFKEVMESVANGKKS